MEDLQKKENNVVQQQKKERFEPLDLKKVDVKVEKGYATSGHNDLVTIQQWKDGVNW